MSKIAAAAAGSALGALLRMARAERAINFHIKVYGIYFGAIHPKRYMGKGLILGYGL